MKYGCIGEKLGHSFSKEIHAMLQDYQYELKEIAPEKLSSFMEEKNFSAINVTIPYKEKVIPYLDYISDTAEKIGAVNTIVCKDNKLYGYNTDFGGMRALIKREGIEIEGKKVLILGTGGTSKTASEVAKSLGASSVYKVSRSERPESVTYEAAYSLHSDADVIINTTPLGMFPNIEGCPVDLSKFSKLSGVVDAVYNPLKTKLVSSAQSLGIKATTGLFMLVMQAAIASGIFLGIKYEDEAVERIYNKILKSKQNIVLIGMPTSGKTTVGKILADNLHREFIDTDSEIEKKTGMSVAEIFEKKGEKEFRRIETEVIKEISKGQGMVIATGGGAVLADENVGSLKMNGIVYFLDRPIENLMVTNSRPLSGTPEALRKLYCERYGIYKRAADVIVLNDDTKENAAKEIERNFLG